jgi:hypothetical protein
LPSNVRVAAVLDVVRIDSSGHVAVAPPGNLTAPPFETTLYASENVTGTLNVTADEVERFVIATIEAISIPVIVTGAEDALNVIELNVKSARSLLIVD